MIIKNVNGETSVNIDPSKIKVVSTKKEDQWKFIFPKKGWFVGAETSGYEAVYLYDPQWIKYVDGWCGYDVPSNLRPIIPKLYVFSSQYRKHITNIDYLYLCEDKDTAVNLANILNAIPSKDVNKIVEDIKVLREKVHECISTMTMLSQLNATLAKFLVTPNV